MYATCAARGRESPEEWQVRAPFDFQGEYPLTVGRRYQVLGVAVTPDETYLLVPTDEWPPTFVPASQFEPFLGEIPAEWAFRFNGYPTSRFAEPPIAVWGYRELVADPRHYTLVVEGDAEAQRVYFARLAEAESAGRA